MPKEFLLSPTVVLRSEPQYYNAHAAFDCSSTRTEFLTEDEYRTLAYIYSTPSGVDEISKSIGIKHQKCERFLNRMAKNGYVQVNPDRPIVRPPRQAKADPALFGQFVLPFLSAPASVDIFVTSRCNLNCVHCFSSTEDSTTRELSLKEVRGLLDQLEELGVFEVRINGGEPLLHPDIDEILMTLKGKRFRKVILTNGTLLNEKKVRLLEESGVVPTVSLDDSNEEGHDLFRGVKGSFHQTVEGLKLLQKHGTQYGVNSCLHRKNLGRHRQIVELAATHGARRIAFLDLKLSGRMRKNAVWIPSCDEYHALLPDLMLDRASYARKIDVALDTFLTCRPLEEAVSEARRGYVSCRAGRSRLSVDSSGAVYPCNLVLSDPKWNMGTTRTEGISDIWFSNKWSFFRGDVKIGDLNKCRDCRNLKRCGDFYCRLVPYLANGDPFGPNPRCG
ncbi:MAG: radical SAM protein [Candidatus Bathyarchaeia archaeon]